MGHVAIVIPDDLHARGRSLAVRQGVSWQDWVTEAIRERVERQEAEQAEADRKRRSR